MTRPAALPTRLFGKSYVWGQALPHHAVLLNPRTLLDYLEKSVDAIGDTLSTMSTPGGPAAQEGAEAGNKPLNGGPSGGRR